MLLLARLCAFVLGRVSRVPDHLFGCLAFPLLAFLLSSSFYLHLLSSSSSFSYSSLLIARIFVFYGGGGDDHLLLPLHSLMIIFFSRMLSVCGCLGS